MMSKLLRLAYFENSRNSMVLHNLIQKAKYDTETILLLRKYKLFKKTNQ